MYTLSNVSALTEHYYRLWVEILSKVFISVASVSNFLSKKISQGISDCTGQRVDFGTKHPLFKNHQFTQLSQKKKWIRNFFFLKVKGQNCSLKVLSIMWKWAFTYFSPAQVCGHELHTYFLVAIGDNKRCIY